MKMKSVLVLLMITNILTVAGCDKTTRSLPATSIANVAYGSDPKQVFDIYLPEGRSTTTTKVMFLFHAGSWSGGDKADFLFYIDSLRKYLPGYAFVNVNYRLANFNGNKFPTQENDVREAVDFVMNKASEYAVSDDVVMLGASAGAHLALLQAYKYTNSVKAKAVISFFGPTDLADMYNNPANPQIPYWIQVLLGGTPASNSQIYKASSPVNFVDAESAPTLIFQGGKDPLVSPAQSNLLKKKLDAAGVPNQLVLYANEGHGWVGNTLSDSFQKISQFLSRYVK
jgi:acetyl esterase/lipase